MSTLHEIMQKRLDKLSHKLDRMEESVSTMPYEVSYMHGVRSQVHDELEFLEELLKEINIGN